MTQNAATTDGQVIRDAAEVGGPLSNVAEDACDGGVTSSCAVRGSVLGPNAWTREYFDLLLESVKDYAFLMIDTEGRLASWNVGAQAMFGYQGDEILGRPASLLFTAEDRALGLPEKELERAASEGRTDDQRWHLRKDGSRFWGDGVVRPVRDADGKLLGFFKVLRDNTDKKLMEDKLRYQLHVTSAIANSAAEALCMVDGEGHLTFMNPTAEEILGWKQEELLGQVLHDRVHYLKPDGPPYPISECPLHAVLSSGRTIRNREDMWIRKDGTFVPVSCSSGPIFSDGGVSGAVLAVHDITEHKRLADMLRERAQAWRARTRRFT
jgi:PAS domain S-box-containing protein